MPYDIGLEVSNRGHISRKDAESVRIYFGHESSGKLRMSLCRILTRPERQQVSSLKYWIINFPTQAIGPNFQALRTVQFLLVLDEFDCLTRINMAVLYEYVDGLILPFQPDQLQENERHYQLKPKAVW